MPATLISPDSLEQIVVLARSVAVSQDAASQQAWVGTLKALSPVVATIAALISAGAVILQALNSKAMVEVQRTQVDIAKSQVENAGSQARAAEMQARVARLKFRLDTFQIRNKIYVDIQEWLAAFLNKEVAQPSEVLHLLYLARDVDHLFPPDVRLFIHDSLYPAVVRSMQARLNQSLAVKSNAETTKTAEALTESMAEMGSVHEAVRLAFSRHMQLEEI